MSNFITALIALLIFLIISYIYEKFVPYDDTDDAANKIRSGFCVRVDFKTGVEYIGGPLSLFTGQWTPRLDENGKPVVRRKP